MLFNFTTIFYWRIVTARKQRKVNKDNYQKKDRQIRHEYTIGNIFYAEKKGIYRKPDDKNQGTYKITEVFKYGTIQVQRGSINKRIDIIQLVPHFEIMEMVPSSNQTEYIWGGGDVSDTTPLHASSTFLLKINFNQRPKSSFLLLFFEFDHGVLYTIYRVQNYFHVTIRA